MKIIVPFLATLFLAAMSLAQEESASPAESAAPATEEKASATVEETPAAKAKEATAATTEKKAEAATSPAAAAKKEATTTTAAKPAAPASAAAPSGKKMSVEAALKDMENRWAAAIAKHDTAATESFVAADYVGINSKGKIQNRRAMLNEMKGDKDTYTSAKNEKLDVHMYGTGVAVVVGTYREKGTGKDGKSFDRLYRFSDTWMDRGGKWQCVASQLMKVKG